MTDNEEMVEQTLTNIEVVERFLTGKPVVKSFFNLVPLHGNLIQANERGKFRWSSTKWKLWMKDWSLHEKKMQTDKIR